MRTKLEGAEMVLCGHLLNFILSISRNSEALLSLRTLCGSVVFAWGPGESFEFSLFVIPRGDQPRLV